MHEDHKYIEALLNKNAILIEEFYEKCLAQCIKYVKNNSGTKADAKDIFQESIVKLYTQAKSGLVLDVPICAYLYVIYKRIWFNILNKKNTFLRISKDIGYISETKSAIDVDRIKEKMEQIFMDCFDKLPDDVKQLFNLRYKDKLSSKEIALKLNIEDNTVNQRFSYYKQILKDCVQKHPGNNELR